MPLDTSAAFALGWMRKARNDLRNIELVLPAADAPAG